jgi:hypothetical protein
MAALPKLLAVYMQAFLGEPDYSHQTGINFVAPSTLQGGALFTTAIEIPAGGNAGANLQSLFPGATNVQFVALMDITNPGQAFTINGLIPVAAGSPIAWVQNGGAPPNLTLTNPGVAAGLVQAVVISL